MLQVLSITLALLWLSSSPTAAQSDRNCGKERWAVKTLTDADTSLINFSPVQTTIQEQASLPIVSTGKNDPRCPEERHVYILNGVILQYKLESDGDLHLILKDPDMSVSMVAEIPNPDCPSLQGSSHVEQYRKCRQWIEDNLGKATSRFQYVTPPVAVNLIGVGFYDHEHGQAGAPKNNREIHPVLSIGSSVEKLSDNWKVLSGTLSINENPRQTILHVSSQIAAPDYIQAIRIIDELGKEFFLLLPPELPVLYDADINISKIPNGMYLIQMIGKTGLIEQRFSIQR